MLTPLMELSTTRLDSDLFKTNRALEATRRLEMMARAPTIGEQPAPPHSHACQHTRIQQESPSACSCRETCGPISAILLTDDLHGRPQVAARVKGFGPRTACATVAQVPVSDPGCALLLGMLDSILLGTLVSILIGMRMNDLFLTSCAAVHAAALSAAHDAPAAGSGAEWAHARARGTRLCVLSGSCSEACVCSGLVAICRCVPLLPSCSRVCVYRAVPGTSPEWRI